MPDLQQNILIVFDSDTKGIDTATEAVQQLANVDKAVKDQFDKTNASLKEREKVVGTLSGGLGELVGKLQNAEKAALGAFGNKVLKDFNKSLNDNTNVVKLLTVSIGAAGEKLNTLGKSTPEYKKLNSEIEQGVALIKQLTLIEEEAIEVNKSFRVRLRELREELQLLEDSGQENTQRFRQLAIEAAKLEDQIGDTSARIRAMSSDTFAFDAAISGVQGVAAAFQAGQGAMALFGSENEELQQALVKLNAIMAITQGLQQVRQTLEKQSAIMIAITNAQQKISIAQSILQGATESKNIVIRYAAITAQKILNAAMAANPAGLLLAAIAAVAGALIYFTSNSDEAAEAQKKLTSEIVEQNTALERMKGLYDELNSEIDRSTALNVAKAKRAGASQKDLLGIEQEGVRQRIANMRAEQAALLASNQYTEETSKRYRELTQSIFEAENQIRIGTINSQTEANKESAEKQKAADEKRKAQREKTSKELQAIEKRNQDALAAIEQRRLQREADQANQGTTAPALFVNIRLQALETANAKQIELMNAQRAHELNNANLTAQEIKNINDKYDLEITKQTEDSAKRRIEIQKEYSVAINVAKQEEAKNNLGIEKTFIDGQEKSKDDAREREKEKEQKRLDDLKFFREQEKALDEEIYQRKADLANTFYNGVMGTIDANERARIQRETEENQALLDNKLITQQEFNKRQEKLKAQEASISKRKAVMDIFVEGAKQLFAIKAQAAAFAANPVTLPLVPLALSQIPMVLLAQSLQLGFIAARKFKTGKIKIEGPGTETSDSIPAYLSRNESVINAKATKKYQPALEAINALKFEEYLVKLTPKNFTLPQMPVPQFDMPTMAKLPKGAMMNNSPMKPIDYTALAKEIAEQIVEKQGHIKDGPKMDVRIDKTGIKVIAKEGLDEIEYVNRRYSFKK